MARKARVHRTTSQGLRIGSARADQREQLACEIRLSDHSECERAFAAGARSDECRKNDHGTGHSHHRLGHRISRESSKTFSACRHALLFVGNQPLIYETAFRNSSLQAAYFILAIRSLGLDCGPMSGFDADKLNANSLLTGNGKSIFSATLATETIANCILATPA